MEIDSWWTKIRKKNRYLGTFKTDSHLMFPIQWGPHQLRVVFLFFIHLGWDVTQVACSSLWIGTNRNRGTRPAWWWISKIGGEKTSGEPLVNARLWLLASIKLTANTSENRPGPNEPSIFRRWLLVSWRLLLNSMTIRRSKRMCDTYLQTFLISLNNCITLCTSIVFSDQWLPIIVLSLKWGLSFLLAFRNLGYWNCPFSSARWWLQPSIPMPCYKSSVAYQGNDTCMS